MPCVPDAKKLKAWDDAHKGTRAALIQLLAACDAAACPTIASIPECRCPKGLPPDACACVLLADSDGDGIPDYVEAQLIAKFSPFLRFTLRDGPEDYRPTDPIWYLTHSRLVGPDANTTILPQPTLATTPAAVLTSGAIGSSSNLLGGFVPDIEHGLCVNQRPRPDYHLDPIDDAAHHGADWPAVMASRNIGLFAHVSPFTPGSAQDLPWHCPRAINDSKRAVIPPSWYETNCQDCLKIEYYQFFGKNADHALGGLGDHEGDWSILTLVYGSYSGTKQILAVSHWAHGYEMRFDLKAPSVSASVSQDPIVGAQQTWIGANNHFTSFNILHLVGFGFEQDEPEKAQNNEVVFVQDAITGEFSHPVAFVENGSHEFWPTSKWGAQFAPAHWGDDAAHSYLSRDIPNLGEIEHPMGDAGAIILGYDGFWGFANVRNTPPPGPALHKSWNWFVPNRQPIECDAAE